MEVRKKYEKYKMTALRSEVEAVIFYTVLIQLGIYYLRLIAFFFQRLEAVSYTHLIVKLADSAFSGPL